MSKLSAGAPLPLLLLHLRRAGWGAELAGPDLRGVRAVLAALGEKVDRYSGTGELTVEQIAVHAGYGRRWTRSRLQLLEAAGLIEWHRGGILEGTARPSWFRVDKRAVFYLLRRAREERDAALELLRAEFRDRIALLRTRTIMPGKQTRRSAHVALSAALPPTGRAAPVPRADSDAGRPTSGTGKRGAAAARAALRAARGSR